MSPIVLLSLLGIGAFFSGAIPFGFIAGKRKGIDIRQHGSKNIGASNVLRLLGVPTGVTVLVLDAAKGALPIFLAQYLVPSIQDGPRVAIGLAAILGHIYSPFVRFRGGKGVATALGVLIALHPLVALITFIVFALTLLLTRYISLGSILGAVTEAVAFWVLPHEGPALPIFGTIVAVFVIIRHRSNMSRLLAGTENKFGNKVTPTPSTPTEEATTPAS